MKKSQLIGVLLMGVTGAVMPEAQAASVPDANPIAAEAADKAAASQLSLFQQAMARVRANYVRSVEDDELIKGAIQGMVSGLDPHSSYLDAKAYSNSLTAT